jgi:hypothetical protein
MHRDAFHLAQSTAGVARWARDHSAVSLTDLNECVYVCGDTFSGRVLYSWSCGGSDVALLQPAIRSSVLHRTILQLIPIPYLLRLRIPQEVAILHSPWRHFPCVDVDTCNLVLSHSLTDHTSIASSLGAVSCEIVPPSASAHACYGWVGECRLCVCLWVCVGLGLCTCVSQERTVPGTVGVDNVPLTPSIQPHPSLPPDRPGRIGCSQRIASKC